MSNLVTVNSGSAINGTLKAGRIAISTDTSITASSGWYNMINPGEGYVLITDGKIQNYSDTPLIYPTQTTLPADILATINGLPDRVGSQPFDNVWDALVWVQSTGKYFILDRTLNGTIAGDLKFAVDFSQPSSYPQSGSTAFDLSGEGNNGTLYNSPTFNTNGYLEFDGTDDYSQTSNYVIPPTGPFTVEFLYKLTTSGGRGGLFERNPSSPYNGMSLGQGGSNNWAFTISSGASFSGLTGVFTYPTLNVWYHDVAVFNGTNTVQVFRNGELIDTDTGVTIGNLDTQGVRDKLLIMKRAASTPIGGDVSSIKIYNNSLTSSEILQNYYGANIITDSLSYRWDAGNLVSYDKTSTTTYALTGSISGSLENGVTFNNPNGGSWEFDGSNDRIVLESSITPGNGNWTISAWVKGRGAIFGNTSGSPIASSFGISSAGNITYYNYDGAWQSHVGNTTLDRSEWYMVTWVNYEGASASQGTMKMYVNGVADSSTFNSYTTNGGPSNDIGHSAYLPNGPTYFDGSIANLQINIGTAFTDEQVSQNYNAELSRFKSSRDISKEGLVLDLDAGNPNSYLSGTTWTDLSGGGSNGTLNNGVGYTTANGGALTFDGSDDYVSLPSGFADFTNGFTVSAIVKFTVNNVWERIIDFGNGSSNANILFARNSNTNNLTFELYTSGGVTRGKVTATGAITNGETAHFAATLDGSTCVIYKNGVAITSTSYPYLPDNVTRTNNYIGKSNWADDYFEGNNQNVKIYNRALSSQEVSNIYTSQAPRYQVQLPRSVTDSLSLLADFGDTTSYPRTGTTVYDRSGNGINGTATNGPVWSFENSGVFDFDGTDDYISFGNPSTLQYTYTTPFSLEVWIKWDGGAQPSNFGHLMGKTYANYRFSLVSSSDPGYITFRLDANNLVLNSGAYISSNVWHHVICTWEPSTYTATIYIDGVNRGQATDNTVDWTNGSQNFQMGTSPGENYYFNGKMALGKAYSKTLSPSEALENYKSTRSRFHISQSVPTNDLLVHLDAGDIDSFSNSDTIWTDLSGNGNNFDLINGPAFYSYNGGSLKFDEADDYASGADSLLSHDTYTKIAIFRPESSTANIISGGNNSQHAFWMNGTSDYLRAGHNGSWSTVQYSPGDMLDKWWIGAVTFSNINGWVLYLNGEEVDTSSSTTSFTGDDVIRVGAYNNAANLFDGDIPVVLVYNRVLNADEIREVYNYYRNRFGLD